MSLEINDKQFEAVSKLPADKRYAYFIGKVADFEELWGLWEEGGWAISGTDDGKEAIAVWPAKRYAQACATDHWQGREAKAIELKLWMEKWIPGMTRDGLMAAVFPTIMNKGIVVSPERLGKDLSEEAEQYEILLT